MFVARFQCWVFNTTSLSRRVFGCLARQPFSTSVFEERMMLNRLEVLECLIALFATPATVKTIASG